MKQFSMKKARGFAARVALLAGLTVLVTWAHPGAAQVHSPAKGSAKRSAILDAMRIFAEDELGAPVEFVVYDMRVADQVAFASVTAQRPGGGAIDLAQTPGAVRGSLDPAMMDGPTMQALLRRSGREWVAVNWAIGALDVWYAYPPYCRRYRAVLAETCAEGS